MQPGPSTAAPPHRAATSHATAAAGPRCHRCGDPNHLANACPHVDLQCRHCQSKGLPVAATWIALCFALHPDLIPSYRRPRNPVGHVAPTLAAPVLAAPTLAAPTPAGPDLDARIKTAISAAFSRMQSQNSDLPLPVARWSPLQQRLQLPDPTRSPASVAGCRSQSGRAPPTCHGCHWGTVAVPPSQLIFLILVQKPPKKGRPDSS